MSGKISVVINTLNEEKNLKQALEFVKWADEILVCDMYSEDKTVEIAKKMGAKVFYHKKVDFVEPTRNFAISKATGDWILILDADEQIPDSLSDRLQELVRKAVSSDFVEIPRKNIIFGKWLKHTGWWPDYQIRFFKKGAVTWKDEIHSRPNVKGIGLILKPEEKWAIIHHNYQTISQFIERMSRYTTVEAEQKILEGYKFDWRDLLRKPLSEFLSRFFANRGFEDGIHGLALSLLQAFSHLLVYLKVWEKEKFKQQDLRPAEFEDETKLIAGDVNYWINQSKQGTLKKFLKIFKK